MRRRRRPLVGGVVDDYPAFSQPAGWAINKPALVAADLSSTFGFVSDDGGIHATYDTLDSGGYIELPATIDRTKPFSFAALIEFNGSTRSAYVTLEDPTETAYRGYTVSIGDGDARAQTGTHGLFLLDDPGDGNRLWLGLSWFPTGDAVGFLVPFPHGPLKAVYDYLGPPVDDQLERLAKNYDAGSAGHGEGFSNLTRIRIGTSSDVNRIVSVICRQGDIRGGPAIMTPTVNGDTTALVRVPAYDHVVDGPRDLLVVFHGAGSNEGLGSTDSGADAGVAFASLMEAGFMMAMIRGTDDVLDYTGPNPSNWGASHTLETWHKPFITEIVQRYEVRNIYLIGLSMGLVNALNYYTLHPSKVKAIVGISGVSNLTHAWTDEGFDALIAAAHDAVDVSEVAPFDPTLHPSRFVGVPIKLWMGDADATLDPVAQVTPFKNAVNALAPGNVESVSVMGADHLVPEMFDGPAILSFLQAHT